jgi:deazaflavin-dependent oxidoreductase (nitroreductase family)
MSRSAEREPRVPPRWFVTTFWSAHRALFRATRGHVGLWAPGGKRGWGALRLTTTGRRSGRPRSVILGYLPDGPNLVGLAMNGWGEGHPAWWLNLEAHPDATVEVRGAPPRTVRARRAEGDEAARLWEQWKAVDVDLDEYAERRRTETPVVVFEPLV